MRLINQSLASLLLALVIMFSFVQGIKSQPLTRFVLSEDQQSVMRPIYVDHSLADALPPVYSQVYFPNCEQAAAIFHGFAYEYNSLMQLSGKDTCNQYPANFTYNFYNQNTQQGVSFFDSFKILYEAGQANHKEFGLDHSVGGLHWMNGEEKWESAMKRRIDRLYSFDLTTETGQEVLKHWIYNHGNGSACGGVAVLTMGSAEVFPSPSDTCPLNYIPFIKKVESNYSHALLIIGYHDSTFFDMNNDGKITTDIDLNSDGKIDLRDSEYGSWIVLNSFGSGFYYNGILQLPYCLSALSYPQFGLCNGEAYGMMPIQGQPKLTVTFNLKYNKRDKLSLRVGFNEDLDAEWPSKMQDIAILNNVGGPHYMQGSDELIENRYIEMAADITPLYASFPANKPVRLYLVLDENDSESEGDGYLLSWKVKENGVVIGQMDDSVAIKNNSLTIQSLLIDHSNNSYLTIFNDTIIQVTNSDTIALNMNATGGVSPYHWSIKPSYSVKYSSNGDLPGLSVFLPPASAHELVRKIKIPFPFPFAGTIHDSIFVWANGVVTFDLSNYQYAYVQDAKNLFSKKECLVSGFCFNYRDEFNPQDSIFYYNTDTSYSIIWHLPNTISDEVRYSGITLYNDGSIDFIRPEVLITELVNYYQGYSTGLPDGQFITNYREIPISDSRKLSVCPVSSGLTVSMSIDGQLKIIPSKANLTQPIEVVVHDVRGQKGESLLHLTQSLLASLDWRSARSQSEELAKVKLKNISMQDMVNAKVYLKANQSGIKITPDYVDVSFIGANQEVTLLDDFKVQYNSPIAFCEAALFEIQVVTLTDTFYIRNYHKPNLINCKLIAVNVDDQVDQALGKGEISDVNISFVNMGSGTGKGIHATVTSLVEGCTIEQIDNAQLYDVDAYKSNTIKCRVHLSASYNSVEAPRINVSLSDGYNEFLNQQAEIPFSRVTPLILNLAKSKTSADSLEKYITLCGFKPKVITRESLSNNLVGEDNVFLVNGMFGQAYTLQEADIRNLGTFMILGGKIYMEDREFWKQVASSTFGSYFGVTSTTGTTRYDSLVGGSELTDGLSFDLAAPHPPVSYSLKANEGTTSLLSIAGSEDKTSAFCKKDDKNVAIGSVYDIAHLVEKNKGDTKRYVQRILDLMGFDTLNMTPNFYTSDRTVKVKDTVKLINCSVGSSVKPEWICQGASVIKTLEDTIWVVYSLPGSYPVKLTISNGNKSKSLQKDGYITVLSNDGVTEPIGKQYTVYPVPASNRITISENEEGERAIRVRLYSIDGQEILRQDNPMIDRSLGIDVSTLKNGTYLLVIESGKSISSYPVVILR